MDSTAFFVLLFLHLGFLVLGFGAVLVIDAYGFLWLIGKKTLAEVCRLSGITQPLIWIGWFGLIVTGVPLLVMKGFLDDLIWMKIFFVGLAGLNGLFLDRVKKEMEKAPDLAHPSAGLIFRIALGSANSQLSWWGAIVIGFYHRHIEHVVRWPKHPMIWMAVIFAAIAAVYLAGSRLFKPKAPAPAPEKAEEAS